MKILVALIAFAVLAGAALRGPGAALAWLALVDAGNYAQS